MVIGDENDPHVAAVLAAGDHEGTLILDVESLSRRPYRLDVDAFACAPDPLSRSGVRGNWLELSANRPVNGWIRRLAPAEWQRGVVLESHESVVKTAWLALIAGMIRTLGMRWLSDLDALLVAENKLVQYSAAARAGIPIPATVLGSNPQVAQSVGDAPIVKPLGPGHFYDQGGEPLVVYARQMPSSEEELPSWGAAPFLVQERLPARRHVRVVTVGKRAWAAAIDAHEIDLDWRRDPRAHRSFQTVPIAEAPAPEALALAHALQLGFTSQDWIDTGDGCVFLDLNPSGQWLFLPDAVAGEVTLAIAHWLWGEE